jgi:hypothetical protein
VTNAGENGTMNTEIQTRCGKTIHQKIAAGAGIMLIGLIGMLVHQRQLFFGSGSSIPSGAVHGANYAARAAWRRTP